jgi:hypothetical protein
MLTVRPGSETFNEFVAHREKKEREYNLPLFEMYPGIETFAGLPLPPPVTLIWAQEM